MRKVIGVVGIAAIVGLAGGACTRIDPGTVGIKVVAGGSDRGVQDFPAQVGWVWYNPLTTSIEHYPTFVQNVVWTRNVQEGHPQNEEICFTNKDQMLICADVNLSYHILTDKVPSFYVKFRSDDLTTFTDGYLHNVARDIFNEHAGNYGIEQIMGDNAQFLRDVRTHLQSEVGTFGVVIDQFGIIGAPRPPQAVIDAINAKVHAVQLAQQKQNEVVQAEADAKKLEAQATGEANATLTRAQAQAQANRELAASITPTLVQYRALEKWNGTLPYYTGSSIPFVNVSPKQ